MKNLLPSTKQIIESMFIFSFAVSFVSFFTLGFNSNFLLFCLGLILGITISTLKLIFFENGIVFKIKNNNKYKKHIFWGHIINVLITLLSFLISLKLSRLFFLGTLIGLFLLQVSILYINKK